MPVRTGKDSKGCYAQFGKSGAKYYYTCGNTSSMNKAKQKAHIQGVAMGEETNTSEAKTSNAPWSSVDKSKLPKSAFMWIEGDGKKKSQWHLPYKDSSGNINLNALRAIAAAIAGARTGKPMNIPSAVRKKINRLLKQYNIGQQKEGEDHIPVDDTVVKESDIREAEMCLWCLTLAKTMTRHY